MKNKLSEQMRNKRAESFQHTLIGNKQWDEICDKVALLEDVVEATKALADVVDESPCCHAIDIDQCLAWVRRSLAKLEIK